MTQLLDLDYLGMQPNQLDASPQVQLSLQDIANNVKIQSNFSISHPDYKPLELPEQVFNRLNHLPADIQHKHLSQQLCSFLYGIYYNGSLRTTLAPGTEASHQLTLAEDPENKTFLGVDLEFYDRLHDSNQGQGYFDSGWLTIELENDGYLVVSKGGLSLHINPEKHLQPAERSPELGQEVSILLPQNLVQNGFYMAVGSAGPNEHSDLEQNSETVRVYFDLSPEGAVSVMTNLTQRLNKIAVPFIFKALYNPDDYVRYDSAVLYFQKHEYPTVYPVLQAVYLEERSHFKAEIPLFTKQLAPGLGLAEEPDRKFSEQESFGTHRCQILANGLLETWSSENDSPQKRMDAILQNFSLMQVDLQCPYLNANSEDIYTQLDV
jgi:hypothetical protein